jgi:3-hydroxyisobutyrate dehydrogenase-like beta-hydroxyacid dehydrogenase
MQIGFIGTGKMGLPMARHLAAAGHEVTGFDLAPVGSEDGGIAG